MFFSPAAGLITFKNYTILKLSLRQGVWLQSLITFKNYTILKRLYRSDIIRGGG